MIPISCENRWDTVYFTYYDDKNIKQYQIIKNFQNYFYYSPDKNLPIVNKTDVIRQTGDHKTAKNFTFVYESDVSTSRKFMLDNFKDLNELPKTKLKIGYLDIECLIDGKINIEALNPITAISVLNNLDNKIYTFAFKKDVSRIDKEHRIAIFNDEKVMLEKFCEFFKQSKFDVITGWNICDNFLGGGFDIPYICNRLDKFGLLNNISNFNLVERGWKDKNRFTIYGQQTVDYMDMYKKFAYETLSSYSLQNICQEELGEGKLDYDGDLNTLYEKDLNKYIDYNRNDVRLLKKLEDKLNYISILDEMRRLSFVNFNDASSNSIVIDNILIKQLHKSGFIVRSKVHGLDHETFEGAYVKEPVPNIYKWVIVLDFTSLYPFSIMNFNISPDSKIFKLRNGQELEYKLNDNEIITPHNIVFNKNIKGIFPQLLQWLYGKRKEYQKLKKEDKEREKEYDLKQQVYKILLNSFYGFMGFPASRFYDTDLAGSVTACGRDLILKVISECEKLGYSVITSDTDSVFICRDDINNKEDAVKVGYEISKYMDDMLKEYCKKFGIENSTFNLKYEKVAKSGLFFKKKRYCLNLVDKEGKDCDTVELKGVSIRKSDSSDYSKQYISKIYEFVMKNDIESNLDVIDNMIDEFRNNIYTASIPDIGLPISINKKIEEYDKNLPMHVRGAKVWNRFFYKLYKKDFEDTQKGKMYFIENTLNDTMYEKLDYVISIPEGITFPKNLIIDYERTKKRIVEDMIDEVIEILDNVRLKVVFPKYKDLCKSNILEVLYNDIDKTSLTYLNQLHKISIYKKFDKFINTTFQNKIFEKYRSINGIPFSFTELICKELLKVDVSKQEKVKKEKIKKDAVPDVVKDDIIKVYF